jgi:hypothetical protein
MNSPQFVIGLIGVLFFLIGLALLAAGVSVKAGIVLLVMGFVIIVGLLMMGGGDITGH